MSAVTGRLHEAFFAESAEALDAMEAALLRLMPGAGEGETINTVFRVVHSIKGSAGMFGFAEIAAFTHTVEALLNELRAGRLHATTPVCDGLLQAVDVVRAMLAARRDHDGTDTTAVRLAAAVAPRLDSIRVPVDKLDELQARVNEIGATQALLAGLARHCRGSGARRLAAGVARLEGELRSLQQCATRMRMLPVASVFDRLPRLVRDLSARLGKQVCLQLSGGQIELDKTALEKLGDALLHLVRNSIDHGIESPAERLAAGKPAEGVLQVNAYYKGGSVYLVVTDDGRGLERRRLLARARSQGLVEADTALSDEQVQELIFLPGFTTAEETTELSGRGVGMDVVARNVKALGGSISLHSEPGRGTATTIMLPLTLAVVDGQIVEVGPETYVLPVLKNRG